MALAHLFRDPTEIALFSDQFSSSDLRFYLVFRLWQVSLLICFFELFCVCIYQVIAPVCKAVRQATVSFCLMQVASSCVSVSVFLLDFPVC